MKRLAIAASIVAVIAGAFFMTSGPPPATPSPPGTFSFGVFGDAPYYAWEEMQFRIVLKSIDAHDLASAIHVGDIFWIPCSDDHYRKALARFNSLRHPVIYTPGDNEWVDCDDERAGGYDPRERLDALRPIFFADPARSVGGNRISLASQPEVIENARWEQSGVVFTTVHVVGTPRRATAAYRAASVQRMTHAANWVRVTFARARAVNATAVVIAFHATSLFERPRGDADRRLFEPLLSTIEEEAKAFGKPVLVAHGDGHDYTVDRPAVGVPNLTRMMVPGSPAVGWVRVIVRPGAASPFTFEPYVVPRWKYW